MFETMSSLFMQLIPFARHGTNRMIVSNGAEAAVTLEEGMGNLAVELLPVLMFRHIQLHPELFKSLFEAVGHDIMQFILRIFFPECVCHLMNCIWRLDFKCLSQIAVGDRPAAPGKLCQIRPYSFR